MSSSWKRDLVRCVKRHREILSWLYSDGPSVLARVLKSRGNFHPCWTDACESLDRLAHFLRWSKGFANHRSRGREKLEMALHLHPANTGIQPNNLQELTAASISDEQDRPAPMSPSRRAAQESLDFNPSEMQREIQLSHLPRPSELRDQKGDSFKPLKLWQFGRTAIENWNRQADCCEIQRVNCLFGNHCAWQDGNACLLQKSNHKQNRYFPELHWQKTISLIIYCFLPKSNPLRLSVFDLKMGIIKLSSVSIISFQGEIL